MEQAQLLGGCRPDLSQQTGVDGSAVSNDLCWVDPGRAQPAQEVVHGGLVNTALHQLIPHQTIAIGTSRVYRQK
jgi:hypothetical protein